MISDTETSCDEGKSMCVVKSYVEDDINCNAKIKKIEKSTKYFWIFGGDEATFISQDL